MSRFSELKAVGTVYVRFSTSPIRVVEEAISGGVPQISPRSTVELATEYSEIADAGKSAPRPSWAKHSGAPNKNAKRAFKLAFAMMLSAALAGCESIGPTVAIDPPAGQSAATFAAEQSACIAQTDRQLQPAASQAGIANLGAALAGNGLAGSQQVVTNAQIQTQYNADYARCMGANGATIAEAGSSPPSSLSIPDTDETWAMFYVTPTYPPNQQATQKQLLDGIWNEVISANAWRGPNASPIHYGAWTGDGAAYEISVADQTASGACKTYGDVSACPAKLTALDPGSEIQPTEDVGTVCIFPKSGGVSTPSHGTRFTYDATSKTILVETLFNGTPLSECSRTIPVT